MIEATCINSQLIKTTSTTKKQSLILLITIASILLISGLFFAKAVGMLRIALCVCPVAIALTLLQTSDQLYIQFTLWIWFLAPLARRIVDQRFGFADQNLVLLAPILVTTLSACCLKNVPRSNLRLRPFLLCIAAVTYGCMIGLLLNPSAEVLYGYLSWLSPILFGLFVYIRSNNYPDLRTALQKTLLQCVAALGIYGIYQYISPPVWDVYWWQSLPFGLVAAFGRPTPYEIRVWSSMNAPQPFAAVMGMCLLLILSIRTKYMVPIAAIGLAAFSLTLVRTEWLGLAVGLIYLASRLKTVVLLKNLAIATILASLLFPILLSIGPTQKIIEARIKSFTHLGSDDSVSTRLAMYQHLTGDLIQNPYGHGVGNKEVYLGYSLDSGPLKMLFNFGVLGTLLYLAGTLAALCTLISNHDNTDIFALGCTAILLSAFAKFLSLSSFMNASGVLVWLAIGMGFLAKRWNLDSRSVSNAPVY
jgi:hypothetical protein